MVAKIKKLVRRFLRFIYTARTKRKVKSYGKNLRVNRFSSIGPNVYLGDYVNFNGMSIQGSGKVTIGDHFHSGRDCLMISQNHNYDSGTMIPYDATAICKDITIGDNVWLGDRVIVLGGAVIGEGAIIQAGSVVVGEIPPCAIAGGHPAKVFKYRDIEHYNTLKAEGKFN